MFSWGVITIGTSGATNFASLAATRFLLGVFEAGKSRIPPSAMALCDICAVDAHRLRDVPRPGLLSHILVQTRGAISPHRNLSGQRLLSRSLWRKHRLRCRTHEWGGRDDRMAMALHPGGDSLMCFRGSDSDIPARLAGSSQILEYRGKSSGGRPDEVMWLQGGRQGHDMGRCKIHLAGMATLCSLFGKAPHALPLNDYGNAPWIR